MNKLNSLFEKAKSRYDSGLGSPFEAIRDVGEHSLRLLRSNAKASPQGTIGTKSYSVMRAGGEAVSRPFMPVDLLRDPDAWSAEWSVLKDMASPKGKCFKGDSARINTTIYCGVLAFALCYDLWKPASRKTPGTFLEVVLGTVMGLALPEHLRTKHIQIPNETESVSTDIVFRRKGVEGGLVVPAKITTRERIVQPFAHQRILDSVFGEGVYHSVLVAASELQRDGDSGVNEICVPGTVRLFQRFLAKLDAIAYLDPPARYLMADVASVVPVITVGELLTERLPALT